MLNEDDEGEHLPARLAGGYTFESNCKETGISIFVLAKIRERVSAFLALPLNAISSDQLKAELNHIGSRDEH
jgi:hypothetical protein